VVPALFALLLRPKDGDVKEPALVTAMRDRYAGLVHWLLGRRLPVGVGVLALAAVTG
jgi:cobalt-zinc-cadmium resistance protein CzcA